MIYTHTVAFIQPINTQTYAMTELLKTSDIFMVFGHSKMFGLNLVHKSFQWKCANQYITSIRLALLYTPHQKLPLTQPLYHTFAHKSFKTQTLLIQCIDLCRLPNFVTMHIYVYVKKHEYPMHVNGFYGAMKPPETMKMLN